MGAYWLHDLPSQLESYGIEVDLYPGWELRSRSTGGFDGVWGVCWHHTASTAAPQNEMYWMWQNTSNYNRPIGNMHLDRTGKLTLGAAGAANTQGRGGPWLTSSGLVPLNEGNKYFIAIEAGNNGIGEVWPSAQLDMYKRLTEALCDIYGFDPDNDVISHQEWAPTRKNDPAGPTPAHPTWGGLGGVRTWDMGAVAASLELGVPLVPSMSDFQITNPVRIVDTRTGTVHNAGANKMTEGEVAKFSPHGYTPDDATGLILTVTAVADSPGFFTFWSGQAGAPNASNVNPAPGVVANNMVWVPMHNGEFAVKLGGRDAVGDVIVDQVGWYWSES